MTTHTPWIIRPRTRGQLRLFCFPYAGGGASIYRLWSSKLPAKIEVWPIQLPGRENRFTEPRYTHITPLVEELARVLHPYTDIPFVFFGHSLGALVCFELARHLRRYHKRGPEQLLVSAHRAPQLPRLTPERHLLSEPDFIQELHELAGTPREVLQNEELMHMMSPLLRADFSVFETYVYTDEPPLACPITAFGGEEDEEVSPQQIAAWQEQTSSTFALKILPGNHFFLQSDQDLLLQEVAHALS